MNKPSFESVVGDNFEEIASEMVADLAGAVAREGMSLYALFMVGIAVDPKIEEVNGFVQMRRRQVPTLPNDELDTSNRSNNELRLATIDNAIAALRGYRDRMAQIIATGDTPS